jgi:hypothetical protein
VKENFCSPPETCLELSIRVFSLVLIVGQPKKSGNSEKNANKHKLGWSELAKRQNMMRTNISAIIGDGSPWTILIVSDFLNAYKARNGTSS